MEKYIAMIIALLLCILVLCACASPEKKLERIIKQWTGPDVEIEDGGFVQVMLTSTPTSER